MSESADTVYRDIEVVSASVSRVETNCPAAVMASPTAKLMSRVRHNPEMYHLCSTAHAAAGTQADAVQTE